MSQCEYVGMFIMCSVYVTMYELSEYVYCHPGAVMMSELIQCVPKSNSPHLNGPVYVSMLELSLYVLVSKHVSGGRM